MKILSIDDSAVVRKIIRGAVEVLGYELIEASDGVEGMEALEVNYQDIKLVLLDYNMPGMNGFEVLKALKNNKLYKRIPVMMVTTESERENIIKAIQMGASHYMVKPFTMEDLLKNMMEALGQGGSNYGGN